MSIQTAARSIASVYEMADKAGCTPKLKTIESIIERHTGQAKWRELLDICELLTRASRITAQQKTDLAEIVKILKEETNDGSDSRSGRSEHNGAAVVPGADVDSAAGRVVLHLAALHAADPGVDNPDAGLAESPTDVAAEIHPEAD